MALLRVNNLVTVFDTEEGPLRAVDDVSFSIEAGEIVGLVGESGCGKSVTALSILRLLAKPQGRILEGEILLNGENLLDLDGEAMRKIRGNQISMIFQDPMTSLNPVFRVGDQIAEAFLLHRQMTPLEARQQTIAMLQQVGIPEAEERIRDYPHQFSGGQRQRIMIAMALACKPKLLIADEPTTALDVTIQAQILELMMELRERFGMAILLITHDLGVVSEVADRVLLMYAGKIVESARVGDFFPHPKHPYGLGLMRSVPRFSFEPGAPEKTKPLPAISGSVPNLRKLPSGCRFSDRCDFVKEACRFEEPALASVGDHHEVSCFEWRNV